MQIPTVEQMNEQIRRQLQEITRLQSELIVQRKRTTTLEYRCQLWKQVAKSLYRKVTK